MKWNQALPLLVLLPVLGDWGRELGYDVGVGITAGKPLPKCLLLLMSYPGPQRNIWVPQASSLSGPELCSGAGSGDTPLLASAGLAGPGPGSGSGLTLICLFCFLPRPSIPSQLCSFRLTLGISHPSQLIRPGNQIFYDSIK